MSSSAIPEPTFSSVHRRRVVGYFAVTAVVALLALLALSGCGGDDSTAAKSPPAAPKVESSQSGFPLTVTDSSGAAVTLSEQPKRIISYSPAVTESLFAIGAGPQLVAVDKFSDYPDGTRALPKLEYSKPAPEPALGYSPDEWNGLQAVFGEEYAGKPLGETGLTIDSDKGIQFSSMVFQEVGYLAYMMVVI